jgi:hypothetical protein
VTIKAPADLNETARSSSAREIHAVFTVVNSTAVTLHNIDIDGGKLMANGTMVFDGSKESGGTLRVFDGAADDVLTGGGGDDVLFGNLGGDTLRGGAGADTFRYQFAADSTSALRDGIQDFALGDRIDLSTIDANVLIEGNQAFSFVGNAAFSKTAGELRFDNISSGGPIWMVQGDTDGNGVSDFELVLVTSDADPITTTDFHL